MYRIFIQFIHVWLVAEFRLMPPRFRFLGKFWMKNLLTHSYFRCKRTSAGPFCKAIYGSHKQRNLLFPKKAKKGPKMGVDVFIFSWLLIFWQKTYGQLKFKARSYIFFAGSLKTLIFQRFRKKIVEITPALLQTIAIMKKTEPRCCSSNRSNVGIWFFGSSFIKNK